ncbi:hypothetical protein PYX08_25110 [Citrobacter freundii]|jgi:hypothetical protein|uniref:hypothetical protein n=1 Tax=Citrobacter freundii complex TaxID=1344959 RepID=UPI000CDBCC53|nr:MULTISPECIES: hypothetical protein [Citrobacter freundii complex]AUZ69065.1 hypothetical protein C2U41_06630 [Citrobacter freundii complex sp. CFNIH4]EKU2184465.1 hypothetical protein [Citrobacter freundii]EKV4071764.1 hypothetical protein [Citrobacter freundii]MBJ8956157.1 hypothetical protein [Citrobacter braakii]MDE5193302.1 hypothetical protein [Citrobacter freundii]
MMSFTTCKLQYSTKAAVQASTLDASRIVVERDGLYLKEMYITGPAEFIGRWVDAKEPMFFEGIKDGMAGISGIIYQRADEG